CGRLIMAVHALLHIKCGKHHGGACPITYRVWKQIIMEPTTFECGKKQTWQRKLEERFIK
ncbi:15407_t:CDS:1, partial [Acaulospora morrowiae]